jgi:hypothetical protein
MGVFTCFDMNHTRSHPQFFHQTTLRWAHRTELEDPHLIFALDIARPNPVMIAYDTRLHSKTHHQHGSNQRKNSGLTRLRQDCKTQKTYPIAETVIPRTISIDERNLHKQSYHTHPLITHALRQCGGELTSGTCLHKRTNDHPPSNK